MQLNPNTAKTSRKKDRKQEIIGISLELLQTHGYENFSYSDIASALGITKASIHYHFAKKADLGRALCQAIEQWHRDLHDQLRSSPLNAREKLHRFVQALMGYAQGPNKVCPLSSLQADVATLPAELTAALKKLDRHELDFIHQVLDEGRQGGEFDFPGSAHAQACIFVLSLKGALQYSRIHGGDWIAPVLQQLDQLLSTADRQPTTMRTL